MSKLEIFIKKCRGIWEELCVEPGMMDDMIDTFIKIDTVFRGINYDLDKFTDEDIKASTQAYINNIIYNINKPKEKNG
jgi:hypothetical protein